MQGINDGNDVDDNDGGDEDVGGSACGNGSCAGGGSTALSREFCDDGLADPDDNTSF